MYILHYRILQVKIIYICRYTGPNCYLPSDMMLYVEMKIKTESGAVIPKNKMVAPCNNVLTTLFRSCRVYLGENLVSKKAENYGYRWYETFLSS